MSDGARRNTRPTLLGAELAAYLEASGLDAKIEEAGIVPLWADLVGPRIAAVTTPLHASDGTLTVSVRSSAWLMELRLMEREIVRRINHGRRAGRIERIRFVMGDGA